MVCVCSGHSSVFGLFRADCFVRVSLQELLPEEILQAALGRRRGGEETHWEVGKAPGLGESRQRDAGPPHLGALKDQFCKSQGRKT